MNCLPWVPVFHRSIDLDGAWRGGRGAGGRGWAVKTLLRPPIWTHCIVSAWHSGDIHSFIYAISFYIGLIMLMSTAATRNGCMWFSFFFFNGSTAPGFILMVKGHETMDKVTAPRDFPSAECLRLHFGTLCWYRALFEGIVEIANATCKPSAAQ